MRPSLKRLLAVALSLLVVATSGFFLLGLRSSEAEAPTPRQAVEQAWRNASVSGAYHFETSIAQVQHPGPSLRNVGRSSTRDTLYLDGRTDLASQTLEMSLWNGASGAGPEDALHVLVENGQAYGRCATCEWEPIDDVYGPTLPGADLLGYLAGAADVEVDGQETILGVEYQRYRFRVDGLAFGAYLAEQMETYLRERGELPPGVSLDLAGQYGQAEGSGELLVSQDGLPRRLAVHIELPAGNAGDWVEADITSAFSRYDMAWSAAPTLADSPRAWAVCQLRALAENADAVRGVGLQAFVTGFALLSLALLVRWGGVRKVYALVAVGMVVSMVAMPLLQSRQVYAYARLQTQRQSAYDEEQRERQASAAQANQSSPAWNPHADPLSQASVQNRGAIGLAGPAVSSSAALLGDGSGSGDGTKDEDGDGLTYAEEARLGTFDTDWDSDGDGITDTLEVEGFVDGSGTRWYLNPRNVDSNGDGLPDSQEWPGAVRLESAPLEHLNTSPDTDQDGIPDVFDDDNDGDGVEDSVDLSPFQSMGGVEPFHRERPLNLIIDQLETGRQVFLDIQLRPENPEHLAYHYNVLDWPTGDTEGQIQRVLDTTFRDQPNSQADGDANGDMRLIPMLEITIPHQSGHEGNLPLLNGRSPVTATTPIKQWVDMAKLDPYGISVSYKNDAGDILMVVPLNLVTDSTGGGKAAFGAHVPYFPSRGTWGAAHQLRVVWLLQMVSDVCDMEGFAPSAAAQEDDALYSAELATWCSMASHRDEIVSIVHAYDERWALTGLSVREDHGIELAVALEDPSTDDRKDLDDRLWSLAKGLENSFLAARTDDQNQLDLGIADIKGRWDSQSNGAWADDASELWGIPKDAMRVHTYTLASADDLMQIPMTITKNLLDTHFVQGGGAIHTTPLLLFARQERLRTVSLGMTNSVIHITRSLGQHADDGVQVVMDRTVVPELTLNALQWQTYRYQGSGWEAHDLTELYDPLWLEIKDRLEQDDIGPDDLDVEDQADLAMSYYLSLHHGASALVQRGTQVYQTPAAAPDSGIGPSVSNPWISIYKQTGVEMLKSIVKFAREMEKLQKQFTPSQGKLDSIKLLYQRYKKGLLTTTGSPSKIKNAAAVGLIVGGAIIALGLTIAASATGAQPIKYVANVIAVLLALHALVTTIQKIQKAVQGVSGFVNQVNAVGKTVVSTSMKAGIVGLVVSLVMSWGMFIASVAMAGVAVKSLAFTAMLAESIANTVSSIIMFAVACIPIVGQIIMAVVALIDALIQAVCAFLPDDTKDDDAVAGVCKGITGWFTEMIKWTIYSQTVMVDLEADDRLSIWGIDQRFVEPSLGLSDGSSLSYSANITTTIRMAEMPDDWKAHAFWWQWDYDALSSSAYDYQLVTAEPGEDQEKLHETLDLSRDDTTDWAQVDEETAWIARQISNSAVPLPDAGINKRLSLYVAEAFALPAQECWAAPPPPPWPPYPLIPVCYVRTYEDTSYIDLGESIKFDVFPATLDDFYILRSCDPADKHKGYALGWDDLFARNPDADGDGLLNKTDGGLDPNDSLWDSDGDGLGDDFELAQGYDPESADGDNDGLVDSQEIRAGTDPYRRDTDGDGLADGEEFWHRAQTGEWTGGWEIVYGFESDGTPKRTWVSSNPLIVDFDGDTLSDFDERLYAYCPYSPNSSTVLTLQSEIREVQADGSLAPTDGFVAPGQVLSYASSVTNQLLSVTARGLFENASHPQGLSTDALAPETFDLKAQGAFQTSAGVGVEGGAASGKRLWTQTAGALLANERVEAGFAEALLHLDEETAASGFVDASGMVYHHGACAGASCPTMQETGMYGYAARFDGADAIDLGSFDITGQVSLAAWIKIDRRDGEQVIISHGPDAQGNQVFLRLIDGKYMVGSVGNLGLHNASAAIPFSDVGQWVHLAGVYDGSAWRLYHNGSLMASRSLTQGAVPVDAQWIVGAQVGGGAGFRGALDEVGIYDMALTASQVEVLHSRPVLHMALDEGAGATTFQDSSGLDNVGVAWPTPERRPSPGSDGVLRRAVSFDGTDCLIVSDNPSLRLVEPRFTLAAWLKPLNTGMPQYDNHVQGVMGWQSDSGEAYPTLQVAGHKLRAGFSAQVGGAGDWTWYSYTSSNDVLRRRAWNHVVATFDGARIQFHVDGQLCENEPGVPQDAEGHPFPCVSGTRLYDTDAFCIGRTSNTAQVYFDKVTMDVEHDAGSVAECYLKWNETWLPWAADMEEGDTEAINYWQTFSESGVAYFMEEDSSSADDTCGTQVYATDVAPPADHKLDVTLLGGVEGTLYTKLYNSSTPFKGVIDDVRVYNRDLQVYGATNEVEDLYNAATIAMRLRLDEGPGAYVLRDWTGQHHGSVPSGSTTRPTTGVAGRVNQAALFDGVDDRIEVGSLALPSRYTLAAWVRGSDAWRPYGSTILEADSGLWLGVNGAGELAATVDGTTITGGAILADTWTHVAYVWDGSRARMYVNGQIVRNAGFSSGAGSGLTVGSGTRGEPWRGELDDVTVYKRALDSDAILTLYQSAPQLMLHCDAPYALSDDSGNGHDGACDAACPAANILGRIDGCLSFNGVDQYVELPSADTLGLQDSDFTVSAWVKAQDMADGGEHLVFGNQGAGGLQLGIVDGLPHMRAYGVDLASETELFPNMWYHMAWVVNDGVGTILLNGSVVTETQFAYAYGLGGDPLYLGGAPSGDNLHGLVDEVTLYHRALSARELNEIYTYQASWVQDRVQHEITIDADQPTSRLESDTPYIPMSDPILGISGRDATSRVTEMAWRVNGGAWAEAPECADTEPGTLYAPTFEPMAEGAYLIETRATDLVGNVENPPASATIYVDDTPPVPASGIADGTLLPAPRNPMQQNSRIVHLTGTVTDPDLIDGSPGSGAASLDVSVYRDDGLLMGAPWQAATLTHQGGNVWAWEIDYVTNLANLTGDYVADIQCDDAVGNATSVQSLMSFRVDTTPPTVTLTDPSSADDSQGAITTTTTIISGAIDDAHNRVGKAVHSSGVAEVEVAYDQTTNGNIYSPVPPIYRVEFEKAWMADKTAITNNWLHTDDALNHAVRGQVGDYALALDGVDDWVETWKTPDLQDRSFTVAFWAKPETSGVILTQGDGLVIGTAPGGGYVFNFDGAGGPTLSMLLAEGESLSDLGDGWRQYAFVYDHEAGQKRVLWRGYGSSIWSMTQADAAAPLTTGGFLAIGKPPAGADRYAGALDSLRIYDRALTADELSAVDRGWWPADTVTPAPDGESGTWSATVPAGLEGFYTIRMRGSDAFTNVSVQDHAEGAWGGMLDNAAPRVSLGREFLGEGDDSKTRFVGYAEDLNLVLDDLTCPCAEDTLTHEYLDDAWYTDVYTGSAPRLSRISWDCEERGHQFAGVVVRARDAYGHKGEIIRGGLRSAALYTTTAEVTDLDVMTDTVYLSLDTERLEAVDVTDPVQPTLLATTGGVLYGENQADVVAEQPNVGTSTIVLASNGPASMTAIQGVTVTYDIDVPYYGALPLKVWVVSPRGTRHLLLNANRYYDVHGTAVLGAFDGEPPCGTWKLQLAGDGVGGVRVTLRSWSIAVETQPTGQNDLASSGSYLYAAEPNGALRIWDVSDPSQPWTAGHSASGQGNADSGYGAANYTDITDDGRYTAFCSEADNLVAGDTNAKMDVFVYDCVEDTLELVSVSSDGVQANNDCKHPRISQDGRWVVFHSLASNLVPGDTYSSDIFLRDREIGTTRRISVTPAGGQPDSNSDSPSISDDGRFIAYTSYASNIVAGDLNHEGDVLVHDRDLDGNGVFDETGAGKTTTVIVSRHTDGTQGDGPSQQPSISSTGRYVVFQSSADSIVAYNRQTCDWVHDVPCRDVFIRDRDTDGDGIFDEAGAVSTELVSWATGGAGCLGYATWPDVSDDGRYVSFSSGASDLIDNDTNDCSDVFVHDRDRNETKRISLADGYPSQATGGDSFGATMSDDGQLVAFHSSATNLVDGDDNGVADVFLWNGDPESYYWEAIDPIVALISHDQDNGVFAGSSFRPAISDNGRYIAFVSDAPEVCNASSDNWYDSRAQQIVRYDREGGTRIVSRRPTTSTAECVHGDWAYLGGENYVEAYLVSDPTLLERTTWLDLPTTVRGMDATDDMLCVVGYADTSDDGLRVYQVTHPEVDEVALSLIAWDNGANLRYSEVLIEDGICYVGGKNTATGASVVAYDVSAPSGQLIPLGDGYPSLANGRGLESMGEALVTGLGVDVTLVDASDPADLAPFAAVTSTGTIRDLRTQDGYVHVANGDLEVFEPVLLPGEEPVLDTIILAPQHETVYTSTSAVEINGWALAAEGWLDDLTVTIAGDSYSYQRDYYPGMSISSTRWSAPSWTPSADGVYPITALTHDTLGASLSDTITVTLDTTWPTVAAYTQVFTQAHYAADLGYVTLSGEATDNAGAGHLAVEATLDGEALTTAVEGATGPGDSFGHWYAYWHVDPANPPDGTGPEMDLDVTVTDRSGRTDSVQQQVLVDVVAPITVPLTMTANLAPVNEGDVIDAIATDLALTWGASADAVGLDATPYWVRWYDAQLGLVRSEIHGPADRSSTVAVIDGQRITASLTAVDINGNETVQTWGPIHIEAPTTPDYVALGEAPAYTGWMNHGCALIGVDARVAAKADGDAALSDAQRLYASWDAASLRLTWTGADWDTDGDLFVYLDSVPGEGGAITYNPYPGDTSSVYLPGAAPDGVGATSLCKAGLGVTNDRVRTATSLKADDPMRAEYAVWAQDSTTAWLLAWSTNPDCWVPVRQLVPPEYVFRDGQADILLSKAELGLDGSAPCDMVAYASEDEALSVWATMPPANPLSSDMAAASSTNAGAPGSFALIQRYHWDSLDLGLCPNGSQPSLTGASLKAEPRLYSGSDLALSLAATPDGSTYAYVGDSLFWLWADLFGGQRPLELSESFLHVDGQHAPLGDGALIEYVLSVSNRGDAPATGVRIELDSHYTLRLLDGAQTTSMLVTLGDLQPGETVSATVQGVVNLAAAMADDYTPCLASHPADPAFCQQFLHWAALDAVFYDSAHGDTPLDWFWADHPVDPMAPVFCGVTSPSYAIAAGENLLEGYAYDDSKVVRVDLEMRATGGAVTSLSCDDCVSAAGQWQMPWDVPVDAVGEYAVRVRAVDEYDQVGPWSVWYAFQVDSVVPDVSLSDELEQYLQGQTVQDGPLYLTGDLSDDLQAESVQVCRDGDCEPAEVTLSKPGVTVIESALPIPVSACPTCVEVPLVVDEPLILGGIRLGLAIEHPHREDLQVDLVAPSGATVRVVDAERSVLAEYANLDVMLSDAAQESLHAYRGDDDVAEPAYDRACRPYAPLNALLGEDASGTWWLRVCDRDGAQDDGDWLSARLELTPRDAGAKAGTWRYAVPPDVAEREGELVWHIRALDGAGNVSNGVELGYIVDRQAPALTYALLGQAPCGQVSAVLSGTVSDASAVGEMVVLVQGPDGVVEVGRPAWGHGALAEEGLKAAGAWSYAFQPDEPGEHTLWIQAADVADNQVSLGPLSVVVVEATPAPTDVPIQTPTPTPGPLSLSVSSGIDDTFCPGWNLGYTLRVANNSGQVVTGVVITTTLPDNTCCATLDPFNLLPGWVSPDGMDVRWVCDALGAGHTLSLRMSLHSFTSIIEEGEVRNGFWLSADQIASPMYVESWLEAERALCGLPPTATPTVTPPPSVVSLPLVLKGSGAMAMPAGGYTSTGASTPEPKPAATPPIWATPRPLRNAK